MRTDKLAAAIMHDREHGLHPCCVVATVGTTSTTSIDPVQEIANIARRENLWRRCRILLLLGPSSAQRNQFIKCISRERGELDDPEGCEIVFAQLAASWRDA